jgi:uroporphyrinogen decarboxylase
MIRRCLETCDRSAIGAVAMGDDMGHFTGTMLSPEMMRKYVFPWQKQVVEVIHSFDLPMILHSCGNLEAVMDDLIDFVGIDAKHSFEDKILPMPEVKKKYGSRIAVLGGIDVGFLTLANEDQVRAYVDRVLEACMPGGGWALGTGNSVANYIPLENYLAMLDEGRKKGIYH